MWVVRGTNFDLAWMLKEHPQKRPNIYEVVQEVCHMQGKEVPIRDVSYPMAGFVLGFLLV